MYKLNSDCITRLADGATIPYDDDNSDYAAYLEWAQTNTALPADAPVKTYAPLSAWQVRKVLTQFNLRTQVEAAINTADQNTKDAWQFANEFGRDNALLNSMAIALGLTAAQLDSMFTVGATL